MNLVKESPKVVLLPKQTGLTKPLIEASPEAKVDQVTINIQIINIQIVLKAA